MCKYCNNLEKNENGGKSRELANGDWTTLRLENFAKIWYLCAYGDDEAGISINYCPFCGVKLGEVE